MSVKRIDINGMAYSLDALAKMAEQSTVFTSESVNHTEWGDIEWQLEHEKTVSVHGRREDFLFHRDARNIVLGLVDALKRSR